MDTQAIFGLQCWLSLIVSTFIAPLLLVTHFMIFARLLQTTRSL